MGSWGINCDQQGWRKGPWTHEEDKLLTQYVSQHGEGRWTSVSKLAGLNRSGKSSRLRWVNYLRPGLKKGHITPQEEGIIIELHALWGNKWSTIARYLPGRTDNEIKNYWRTHFKKRKSPCDNKQVSKKFTRRKQEENSDDDDYNKNTIPSLDQEVKRDEENGTKLEMEIAYIPNRDDNHQYLPMINYQDNYTSGTWCDSIPVDSSYLWDGLWDLDDQNCIVGKTVIHNHTNADHNYSRGGDNAVNYMYTGGYIF